MLSKAPELKWSEGDNWHATLQLPAGACALARLRPARCRCRALLPAAAVGRRRVSPGPCGARSPAGFHRSLTPSHPAGGVAEYKYVLLDHSGQHAVAWQAGNNSVLALRPGEELIEVFDNW